MGKGDSGFSAIRPTGPAGRLGGLLTAALVLLAIVVSIRGTEFSLATFLSPATAQAVRQFLEGLFPPNLDPAYLGTTLGYLLETIEISILGTALAVAAAFPLSLLATGFRGEETQRGARGTLAWALRWGLFYAARGLLNLLRGIPELVWALIFVVAVGLGPMPGVLALAAHSSGVLGKLYAELFEGVDEKYVENARAAGASGVQVLAFVQIPASLPAILSYTLFRWECNMRAATVLGFVGAGGIGTQLIYKLKLFQYAELSTLIIEMLILVALVDLVSQFIRGRLLARGRRLRAEVVVSI